MRMKFLFVGGLLLTIATAASAETKFSGAQLCAKPDPEYTVAVGDRPDHMMSLAKDKCTWTSGDIGGVALKDEEDTNVLDIRASSARERGIGVISAANGEKVFIQYQGTATLKDKAPVSDQGTFSFTGGTGKMKGLTGKGTYTGKFNADGTASYEIEGEYQLAVGSPGK